MSSHKPQGILFFDLEVDPGNGQIQDIGALLSGRSFHGRVVDDLFAFAKNATVVCGHNIVAHDLPVLQKYWVGRDPFFEKPVIDTLYWSALLFPRKPYHHLVKDYQLAGDYLNDPLADARLVEELLGDCLAAYHALPGPVQTVYFNLLGSVPGFAGFFQLLFDEAQPPLLPPAALAVFFRRHFGGQICGEAPLEEFIGKAPVELAYAAALIAMADPDSRVPPWVLRRFPEFTEAFDQLRLRCAGQGACPYCPQLNVREGLRRFFGFEGFRRFEGDGARPLQEQVVEAALAGHSLLAVFPTGGGKSLAFQLPALMAGEANRSLTVVISPLQSLMKDQVDVLRQRHAITSAVTINGLLSPLERSEAIERVRDGGANLLYLSPESLRSHTILRLLRDRQVCRFVIDEAHCFSAWGQDFRVDYLYIAPFLRKLQRARAQKGPIPVSCFTATAKPAVVEDICNYFRNNLGLDLSVFQTSAKRHNLSYSVLKAEGPEEKFHRLRELLVSEPGPKIVYVSRVKTSERLAEQLRQHGIRAQAFNGQLDRDEKVAVQDAFMRDDGGVEVIVATSAFGMGVDKDNVRAVVHYNISDSLENYIQESGRAGRRADLEARCYVLFDENDLDEHFNLLNATKLSHKEIYQIWQGIKRFRKRTFTRSALEIARQAGWDTEITQLETRVKAAIAALEDSGYLRREENAPRIFAQSILVKNADDAGARIDAHRHLFAGEEELTAARRIFGSLISRARSGQDTQVDGMADALGLERDRVAHLLNLFRQIGLLSQDRDLTAFFNAGSVAAFQRFAAVEQKLLDLVFPPIGPPERKVFLRELNEAVIEAGLDCNPLIIRDIFNYWSIINVVFKERTDRANEQYRLRSKAPLAELRRQAGDRLRAAAWCLEVFQRSFLTPDAVNGSKGKRLLSFSVTDLKEKVEELSRRQYPLHFYESLLLYLHHVNAIELKSGLLVYYNPMKIIRREENNRKQYTRENYRKLEEYYQNKTEQIHVVGEYARRQLQYGEAAVAFVDDYFTMPYADFLNKYFRNRRGKIKQPITEQKFQQIFGALSAEQLNIVKDKDHDNILVAAGPGSGKTRVLVHKVASLLMMEDIKPEQFLMLTFSRPAALEFRARLRELIGKVAYHIDIFTYHGFAFRLAGRLGNLERSQNILDQVSEAIRQETLPLERLRSKSVVVIDEYQDVSEEEYRFLDAIIRKAEKIRVIAVGDDDQNVYEFRGADIRYMRAFARERRARIYFLTVNYRARANLLAFTNRYLEANLSPDRLKKEVSLQPFRTDLGTLEVVRHSGKQLILPLVEQVLATRQEGTAAVLTQTNEEAVLIASMLRRDGRSARLIADREGFTFRDLLEIRSFTHWIFQGIRDELGVIPEEAWQAAKEQAMVAFAHSENLELLQRVIKAYESGSDKKFKSTWNAFLRESRTEDFYAPERDAVLVSTMHKAKGKEFNSVYILLNRYPLTTEEKRRVLYVALTRARDHLFIHTNRGGLPTTGIPGLRYREEQRQWPAPEQLILTAGMKDVWLSFFTNETTAAAVKELQAGQALFPAADSPARMQDAAGRAVVWLSRSFEKRLQGYLDKGYVIEKTTARHLVVWFDAEVGKDYRVVLPELNLRTPPIR